MSLILAVQKNRVFRFLSSVKLAVPLMFVILISCAYGTILESQYNSQIATLRVYRSFWFLGLMCLLWTNIFSAALSRFPFKKHHTGFVITHIGLLTLLIGGMITATTGTDGQLRVSQGSSDNEVFLSNLILRVDNEQGTLRSTGFNRTLRPLKGEDLDKVNDALAGGFSIDEYQPFVTSERGFAAGGPGTNDWAVRFSMKSQFFNVTEWLNSKSRPEIQMGPATLRIVVDGGAHPLAARVAARLAKKTEQTPHQASHGTLLRVKEAKSGKVLGEFSMTQLKQGPQSVGPFKLLLVRALEEAMVAGGGKIEDQGTRGKNPALDLKIEHQNQSVREVVFARFPTFSMHPNGVFGLKFEYLVSGTPVTENTEVSESESPSPVKTPGSRQGNVVEFHIQNDKSSQKVRVELYKNGESVLKQDAKENEPITTPWMGMVLTLNSAVQNAMETEEVRPTELQPRSPMQPSAIRVRAPGTSPSEAVWIIEGDRRGLQLPSGTRYIYYGPDSIRLPFQIQLNEFSKIDYPGTETPMSYQSKVKVNGQGEDILIAMNEPLHRAGYTLYQSSYVLEPGQPPVSIFSVNQDPGRPIKYGGSLILVIGIATFTLMRSHWYLARQNRKAVI